MQSKSNSFSHHRRPLRLPNVKKDKNIIFQFCTLLFLKILIYLCRVPYMYIANCCIQSSAETYIRFIMNSIGGKTLSPDIIGTATISGAKLFLMKDLKLIYIFQDKLIIKFYFKVTKRNANLPFLSVNFPSVCSEITSQIVCKFLQIIVYILGKDLTWETFSFKIYTD